MYGQFCHTASCGVYSDIAILKHLIEHSLSKIDVVYLIEKTTDTCFL